MPQSSVGSGYSSSLHTTEATPAANYRAKNWFLGSRWLQGAPRPEPPQFQQMCREGAWSTGDEMCCALGAKVWCESQQLHPTCGCGGGTVCRWDHRWSWAVGVHVSDSTDTWVEGPWGVSLSGLSLHQLFLGSGAQRWLLPLAVRALVTACDLGKSLLWALPMEKACCGAGGQEWVFQGLQGASSPRQTDLRPGGSGGMWQPPGPSPLVMPAPHWDGPHPGTSPKEQRRVTSQAREFSVPVPD